MSSISTDIRDALRDVAPMAVGASPFGMVFGAASVANGYTVFETMVSSVTLFAGASQFVLMEVNGFGVPAWSVALAVFAVNFRHVLYSAATGRRIESYPLWQKAAAFFLLTDLQYAAAESRATAGKGVSPAYYFTLGGVLYFLWVVTTWLGALGGSLIADPKLYGLDFLLPIYFLAVLMGFRKRTGFLPVAAVSAMVSIAAWKLLGPPWHFALGGLAGVGLAAFMAAPDRKDA